MRIATSTTMNMAANASSGAYANYVNVLAKIISGKNFTKVSQDVLGATKVLKINDELAKLDEYQGNIDTAMKEMSFVYDTLGAVNDKMTEINGLIVEAANASTTPESAKAIATDIKEKVNTIVSKMNSKYLDNYIFSGTNTEKRTYETDEDGNLIYQGSPKDAQSRNLTISEGKTFSYNVCAESFFGELDGKTDFFSQMNELDELLNAEPLDYNAIREKIGVLEETQNKVIQTTGAISAKVSKLDATEEINNSAILSLTENKKDIEELDLAKAATELANARNSLQASYTISSEILKGVSLLDYL